MLYHLISCYIMLYHVIWCYIMLYQIVSCFMMLYHVIWCYIMLYHVLSCYIISCVIMFYHVLSCFIVIYHVISCSWICWFGVPKRLKHIHYRFPKWWIFHWENEQINLNKIWGGPTLYVPCKWPRSQYSSMPGVLRLLIFSGLEQMFGRKRLTVFPESSQMLSPWNEQLDNSPTKTYPIFAPNNSNKK